VATFGRKTFRHLHELAATVGQAVGQLARIVCNSSGMFRDNGSHIWMGRSSSAARRRSTSRRFSPACWRPVKNNAIEWPPIVVETMPDVKIPVRSGDRAPYRLIKTPI
jgi:hypothetical protein